MDFSQCAYWCREYKYFGIESTDICFCGNELKGNPVKVNDAECLIPCPGDPTLACGGPLKTRVYTK
jgi:hypothetical protein